MSGQPSLWSISSGKERSFKGNLKEKRSKKQNKKTASHSHDDRYTVGTSINGSEILSIIKRIERYEGKKS